MIKALIEFSFSKWTLCVLAILSCAGCTDFSLNNSSNDKILPTDDLRFQQAVDLRYPPPSLYPPSRDELIASKEIFDQLIKDYPYDVAILYELCQYDTIVSPIRGNQYCNQALDVIKADLDVNLEAYEKIGKKLDINKKKCEFYLIENKFNEAINSCKNAQRAIQDIQDNIYLFPVDHQEYLRSSDFKYSQEIYVDSLLKLAEARDNEPLVMIQRPFCHSNPSDMLCLMD